jgi:hypothetical protein
VVVIDERLFDRYVGGQVRLELPSGATHFAVAYSAAGVGVAPLAVLR